MSKPYREEETAPLISRPGIPTAVQDKRTPRQKRLAVYIILVSVLFERIAFYILAANLAFNFESEKVSLGPLGPSTTSLLFSGTSYIATIIFAVISDWKLGRGKTIILGFVIYLIGYISTAAATSVVATNCTNNTLPDPSASSDDKRKCLLEIIPPLILIIIGAGAVQSNLAVFGAEQIQESKLTSRFFDKYVIVINISSIFAVLAIRNIVTSGSLDKPVDKYQYPSIIAASVLFIAALLFALGYEYYIHIPPHDTVITNIIPVYKNAFETWQKYRRNINAIARGQVNSIPSNSISSIHNTIENVQTVTTTTTTIIYNESVKLLEFAKGAYGGKFPDRMVDDVKSLRKAFMVFSLLIPYWMIYQQLSSTFAIQAKYMLHESNETKDSFDKDNIVAYMWLGDPVTIIICLLTFHMFVYNYLDGPNYSLTITRKFLIGMFLGFITMIIAGTVEVFRQKQCDKDYGFGRSNLTVFYQLPQNIFMGLSETFVMVASFEYAFFAAPRSAQTLFMSLRFCSLGISSFFTAAYMIPFSTKDSSINNKPSMSFSCPMQSNHHPWTLYAYFFILGGIQFIFMLLFNICQKKFRIIKLNPQQIEQNQFIPQEHTSTTDRHEPIMYS